MGSQSDKFNEHVGAHDGGVGTEVHRHKTWGRVIYIASKEGISNLSEELVRRKYRWRVCLCLLLGLDMR